MNIFSNKEMYAILTLMTNNPGFTVGTNGKYTITPTIDYSGSAFKLTSLKVNGAEKLVLTTGN